MARKPYNDMRLTWTQEGVEAFLKKLQTDPQMSESLRRAAIKNVRAIAKAKGIKIRRQDGQSTG